MVCAGAWDSEWQGIHWTGYLYIARHHRDKQDKQLPNTRFVICSPLWLSCMQTKHTLYMFKLHEDMVSQGWRGKPWSSHRLTSVPDLNNAKPYSHTPISSGKSPCCTHWKSILINQHTVSVLATRVQIHPLHSIERCRLYFICIDVSALAQHSVRDFKWDVEVRLHPAVYVLLWLGGGAPDNMDNMDGGKWPKDECVIEEIIVALISKYPYKVLPCEKCTKKTE